MPEEAPVNVRIGIADASREIELELDQPAELEANMTQAFADGTHLYWVTDVKGRRIGIPLGRVAYIEINSEARSAVGFG
jgi:hypothetical protein